MRDIAPAVRRIAKIEAQIAALQDKRDKESRRIRFAGRVEVKRPDFLGEALNSGNGSYTP